MNLKEIKEKCVPPKEAFMAILIISKDNVVTISNCDNLLFWTYILSKKED